ncbi:MAG: tetratricopeptide repeat protein [Anaerolineales bacterium]
MTTDEQLRDARELLRAGDAPDARDILIPLLRAEPDNLVAWQLYAVAARTAYHKHLALENILRLDPDHKAARRMLAELYRAHAESPTPPDDPGPRAWAEHACHNCGGHRVHPRDVPPGSCALCGADEWRPVDEKLLRDLLPDAARIPFALNLSAAQEAARAWQRGRLWVAGLGYPVDAENVQALYVPTWRWVGRLHAPWHAQEEVEAPEPAPHQTPRYTPNLRPVAGTLEQTYEATLASASAARALALLGGLLNALPVAQAVPLYGADVLSTALYGPDRPAEAVHEAARAEALHRARVYLASGRDVHNLRLEPSWADERAELVLVPLYIWRMPGSRQVVLVDGVTGAVAGDLQPQIIGVWRVLAAGWIILAILGVLGAWPSALFGVLLALAWGALMVAWWRYAAVARQE